VDSIKQINKAVAEMAIIEGASVHQLNSDTDHSQIHIERRLFIIKKGNIKFFAS
jgi:hypothetical protein